MTEPFPRNVDTTSVGSVGPLSQEILLEAARMRMTKRVVDQEGQAALQLIQSATAIAPDATVGTRLNIVA